jgi:hypothetical protein
VYLFPPETREPSYTLRPAQKLSVAIKLPVVSIIEHLPVDHLLLRHPDHVEYAMSRIE